MVPSSKIRKKLRYNSPNSLFERWLTEWRDDAAAKGKKSHHTFARALRSLKKYPLPLSSGKEAKILEHFGDKICSMLDEKLQQHKFQNGNSSESQSKPENKNENDPKKIPTLKATSGISKTGQPCSSHLGKSEVMPCGIFLPESVDAPEVSRVPKREICLLRGTHEIVLCVDNCETLSSHSANKKIFLSELKKSGIHFEIRKLNVGDFLWIARRKGHSDPQEELVMDFIVERKRLDDLSHSIKDGRFREQKFRLKNCGLKYPVYLAEYHASHKHSGIPETTLEQAIVNTQIVDGFIIKRTQNTKESVSYLLSMTKYLQNSLQMQTLASGPGQAGGYMTFEEFNHGSIKNKCLTVQEMFAKQLLQFHGLSVDRASALTSIYPTPSRFFEALDSYENEADCLKHLSEVKFGKSQRNIGCALGKHLLKFYTTPGPLS